MSEMQSQPTGPYDELLSAEVKAAREAGRPVSKIPVIKALREATGLGLKEAKDVVENYGERYAILELRRAASGCSTAVAMIIVFLAIIYRLA